jgi:hypothetical protein
MATADLLTMAPKTGDRQKALDSALAQIERQFGKGSIMTLGEGAVIPGVEATSTGSIGLDIALGIGGLPKGRIIEIYGPESSGKTTLTLHCVAEEQKKGGVCAFVDAEHALDPQYAQKLGVNLEELLISQPDTGEQALEITDTLVRSGAGFHGGGRFCGRFDTEIRIGRRYGRCTGRCTGPLNEPSHAQIDRQHQQIQLYGHFYQPNSDENRRYVRQPGNHDRRQCAEILFFGALGYTPDWRFEGS